MKWFKHLTMTLLLLLMTACAGDNLEKMILFRESILLLFHGRR